MAKRRLASSGAHYEQDLLGFFDVIVLVTALAEKPPASAGYRGSNLMHWRRAGKWRRRTGFERNIVNYLRLARRIDAARKSLQ